MDCNLYKLPGGQFLCVFVTNLYSLTPSNSHSKDIRKKIVEQNFL